MCMQCMTKAEMIKANILPGWFLVRATKTYDNWKKGMYGLLRCNDPDFIFKTPITKEPRDIDKKVNRPWSKWMEECRDFDDELQGSVAVCHEFYLACVKAGYKGSEKDGFIAYWLRKYMAKRIR